MVRTLDLWLAVAGSNPGHDTAWYFWDRWPYFAGKLSWDITTTQVNSALHLSGVAKSSTSFGWGKGGKVTSAGWQVTLCDLIWHVISRSGVVISITNCYIRFTFTYLLYSADGSGTPVPGDTIFLEATSRRLLLLLFREGVQWQQCGAARICRNKHLWYLSNAQRAERAHHPP